MIPLDDAHACVLQTAAVVGTERVSLWEASGRVLREDVFADRDQPPFHRSAMDGYACRRGDLEKALVVGEVIAAGSMPRHAVTDGCCAKIMTGSPVPEGADCVVPVEDTRLDAAGAMLCERVPGRDNISRCGEDCLKGATLLSAGTIICPQDIAVLASVGCSMPLVSRKVRVAIIATGDELIEPDAATPESDSAKIRNSNAYQLIAQVERAGATARYFGIVKDDEDSLTETFCAAKNDSDILLVSGGVSMGDFDYVPAALTRAGFRFLFEKIKIKPGKPTVFGTDGERYCFGLPGNPVSTFVVFEILVRDFIAALQGAAPSCATVPLKLAETISRKNIERHDMIPVRYGADGLVHPVLCHGSGHFHALHGANGLIGFPVGVARLQEGALVDVRPI